LISRGITLSDLLALDVALPIPVKGSEGISFSSPNPNYQPEPIAKGAEIVTSGVYTHPLAADFLQLQFMKHSKLGPCDTLLLTDGSFDSAGNRIGGSYLLAFEGRELSNRFISVPGNKVVWRNIAKRCENEFKGFYAEDVTSLGFRVVNVQAQKFKLKASKSSNGFYRFQVLDDGGAATYILFIEQPGEKEIIFSGRDALLNLKSDLPVRSKMQRNDGVEISLTDSLSHLINLTANNN